MAITAVRAISRRTMSQWLNGIGMYTTHTQGFWDLTDLVSKFDNVIIISISDHDKEPLTFAKDAPVLTLQFDDIDLEDDLFTPVDDQGVKIVLADEATFNVELAKRIIAFMDKHHRADPKSNDLLLVNCHMGISRSGAVITWAARRFGILPTTVRAMNPQISPNRTVMKVLESL